MGESQITKSASTAFARASEAAEHLKTHVHESLRHPKIAVICGSGLGGLRDLIEPNPISEFDYGDIPYMTTSTVAGHASKMIFGKMGGAHSVPIVLLVGRAHFYEGHDMDVVTFATRLCKCLGVETILGKMLMPKFDDDDASSILTRPLTVIRVTNAAGGLSDAYNVGDVVLLKDHFNIPGFAGFHPLRGPNEEDFGVRFPPLSDAYDLALRRKAHRVWNSSSLDKGKRRLHEGVYAFCCGPTYETRAEVIMLKTLGADLVGMSTVPEVIVARHSGMRVLGMSLVTNNAVCEPTPRGDAPEFENLSDEELADVMTRGAASHAEVLKESADAAVTMQAFVRQLVEQLATS